MKQFPTKKILSAIIITGFLMSSVTYSAPSIQIKATAPKGSAGELPSKYIKNTWTPCIDTDSTFPYLNKQNPITKQIDALEFNLVIKNEGSTPADTKEGNMKYDVYFFFVNNMSGAIYNPQQSFSAGLTLIELKIDNIGDAIPFKAAADYLPGDGKQKVFGAPIRVDGINLSQGLWSAVAVMIEAGVPLTDFNDWEAFSVAPIILGTPAATATTCK